MILFIIFTSPSKPLRPVGTCRPWQNLYTWLNKKYESTVGHQVFWDISQILLQFSDNANNYQSSINIIFLWFWRSQLKHLENQLAIIVFFCCFYVCMAHFGYLSTILLTFCEILDLRMELLAQYLHLVIPKCPLCSTSNTFCRKYRWITILSFLISVSV